MGEEDKGGKGEFLYDRRRKKEKRGISSGR
jgi:hypothetical protein